MAKKRKKAKKEKLTLSDKFQELPWWVPPSGFAIILLILHFTTELGVGYWFFFLLGAGVLYFIICVIIALFGKSNF